MSGYLEVKYPFKSNLGLNPFKSWKRQWCILRPSPTSAGGGSLAVYCSEAGAPAGTVELRTGCIVKRAKSRTRPYAFAVFSIEEPCKPRILLAAQSLSEAQLWMDKIRDLLNGETLLGTETLLKDSYPVTIIPTELSLKCGFTGDSCLTLSSTGITVSRLRTASTVIRWQNITDVHQTRENGGKNKTCVLSIDSSYSGGGEMWLSSSLGAELCGAVRQALRERARGLSRSQPDLSTRTDDIAGEVRRSSWYSGPSEVSLDDTDLIMSKEAPRAGPLSRCSGAPDLAQRRLPDDHSMCDRRSLSVSSVSSGVYEEIAEEAPGLLGHPGLPREEPTYESVADCIYATMRRGRRYPPPPLPPRQPFGTLRPGAWRGAEGEGVTRHSSLGSLHRKHKQAKPFSVFRKRLKSDSRIATSPKSDIAKENKDVESKKKRFDFPPPRDIFKSFKVGRKMKGLKISTGETKSCEFLDETQHVTASRCAKSVECLEGDEYLDEVEVDVDGDRDLDLSLEVAEDDSLSALALPQEIVRLILRGRDITKVRLKEQLEGEYVPMSPAAPPAPAEHHYMVMSPRAPSA